MILVTVGMQLGFDRLIEAMDAIAPTLDCTVIAQTGQGTFRPVNMEARTTIPATEFEELIRKSSLVVSHAGIGTILTAQRLAKPVVLLPRRADLNEHRNDHQLATVQQLEGRTGILIAKSEGDLAGKIAEGLSLPDWASEGGRSAETLRAAVAHFIETGRV